MAVGRKSGPEVRKKHGGIETSGGQTGALQNRDFDRETMRSLDHTRDCASSRSPKKCCAPSQRSFRLASTASLYASPLLGAELHQAGGAENASGDRRTITNWFGHGGGVIARVEKVVLVRIKRQKPFCKSGAGQPVCQDIRFFLAWHV